jgi:DNA-binding GntR family transcriptional regulator
VAEALLQQARRPGNGKCGLSQSGLADLLDVSRDIINDTFKSLQDSSAIRFERHQMIINIKTLERIAMKTNTAKAYVLLRTRACDSAETAEIVRRQPGVVMADQIEGAADVIFAVQACDRESLASLMVRAIASVEDRTEDIQLLPTREPTLVGV